MSVYLKFCDMMSKQKRKNARENNVVLSNEDINFLLTNTEFDEYEIREWFREFVKVSDK